MKRLLADYAIFCSVVILAMGGVFLLFTATLDLQLREQGLGLMTFGMLASSVVTTRF